MSKRELINFGDLPLVNTLSKNGSDRELTYPLVVGFDDDTKLVSLINNADQELLFPDDYVYDSSQSNTMIEYFKGAADYLKSRYNPTKVLEIGSNSGIFIKHFLDRKPIAVEPCQNFADRTNEMGIRTEARFWDMELAEDILSSHGKQDLIYSANTMTHVHNLEQSFEAVCHILEDDGIFVIDGPALKYIIEKNAFDQFYHEHQSYFSLMSLKNILKPIGLKVIDVIPTDVHGGSYRIFIAKNESSHVVNSGRLNGVLYGEQQLGLDDYDKLASHFETMKYNMEQIKFEMIVLAACADTKIVGYGATAKFTQVCNMCGITDDIVDYVVDTTPDKWGKFIPNTNIPIIQYTDVWSDGVTHAYLGAWNYKKEITGKEAPFMKKGGKFITHVPELHLLTTELVGV
jgi:methylation protein EvaC